MHHLLEIIIPNDTKDIKKAISETMSQFDENGEDSYKAFWDWYVIGGRFAGMKFEHTLDQERLEKFNKILKENHVTVSSLTCGKQTISPAEQIPFVDKTWNDLFPENDGRACPLFSHSNDQYDKYGIICGDIMPVKECLDFECGHVIIATKNNDNEFMATYMLLESIWNGVTHQDTKWDGKIGTALEMFKYDIRNYREDYKKTFDNIENWLSITIDYHS